MHFDSTNNAGSTRALYHRIDSLMNSGLIPSLDGLCISKHTNELTPQAQDHFLRSVVQSVEDVMAAARNVHVLLQRYAAVEDVRLSAEDRGAIQTSFMVQISDSIEKWRRYFAIPLPFFADGENCLLVLFAQRFLSANRCNKGCELHVSSPSLYSSGYDGFPFNLQKGSCLKLPHSQCESFTRRVAHSERMLQKEYETQLLCWKTRVDIARNNKYSAVLLCIATPCGVVDLPSGLAKKHLQETLMCLRAAKYSLPRRARHCLDRSQTVSLIFNGVPSYVSRPNDAVGVLQRCAALSCWRSLQLRFVHWGNVALERKRRRDVAMTVEMRRLVQLCHHRFGTWSRWMTIKSAKKKQQVCCITVTSATRMPATFRVTTTDHSVQTVKLYKHPQLV